MLNLKIPDAPKSIQKGVPLKLILDLEAITQLGENLETVHPDFDKENFIKNAMEDLKDLSLTERSQHISETMAKFLPKNYSEAIEVILNSLTPPLKETEGNGLATLFYMPHCNYISKYGLEHFDISIKAQYELTKRFTCEFSIRPFIINDEDRTMKVLYKWMKDPDPHIRRLASEGTRPRLPWAMKIDSFVKDPTPSLLILEELKNDPDLYVRRSVANHVGDIAKDNPELAFDLCGKWLIDASPELNWIIRHAVRNPFKKGNERAIALRKAAK
jgi:3-methyladenine DNA glycosylase AlkC